MRLFHISASRIALAVAIQTMVAGTHLARAQVAPIDVWLACRHPLADSASIARLTASANALKAVFSKNDTSRSTATALVAKAEQFAAQPASTRLQHLCSGLLLPSGSTRSVADIATQWDNAQPGLNIPTADELLTFAAGAESETEQYFQLLDRMETMRGAAFVRPLSLAVYFAPNESTIKEGTQVENIHRLVDAIRNALDHGQDSVVIEGRADYSGADKASDGRANAELAAARARFIKLLVLQTDNRIDERKLVTHISVLDSSHAEMSATVALPSTQNGGEHSNMPKDSLAARLLGIRVGYRAGGVSLPAIALLGSARLVDTSLSAAQASAIGNNQVPTEPIQWATALAGVVVDRAKDELQTFLISAATDSLCTRYSRMLATTCGVAYQSFATSVVAPRSSLESAVKSAEASVKVAQAQLDAVESSDSDALERARKNLSEAQASVKAAKAALEERVRKFNGTPPSLDDMRAALRVDLATLYPVLVDHVLANSEGQKRTLSQELRGLLGVEQEFSRTISGGLDPEAALIEFATLPANSHVLDSDIGKRLFMFGRMLTKYRAARSTLAAAPSAPGAERDTLLLFSARALIYDAPTFRPVLKPSQVLNRAIRAVVALDSLGSTLRGLRDSPSGDRVARLTITTARYGAYARTIAVITADEDAMLTISVDSLLVPALDVISAAETGNLRAAFGQLNRLRIVSGSVSDEFASPSLWRVVSLASDLADATSRDEASAAMSRFVGESGGLQRKKGPALPGKVVELNAYVGGTAGVGFPINGYGGAFVPVGLEIGHSRHGLGVPYYGLLLFPIDLGAVSGLRAVGDHGSPSKIEMKQLVSPGAALLFSVGDSYPISLGPVIQRRNWAPSVKTLFGVVFAVDVPIFP